MSAVGGRVLKRTRRSAALLLSVAWLCGPTAVRAQEGQAPEGFDFEAEPMARFTGAPWALMTPNRDYEGGCVVGFLAFRFSPTGYFVYNNHIRGSWRVDELGNLVLRTKDGLKFTLIVEGDTLRPTQNLPFARRFYEYQRCST